MKNRRKLNRDQVIEILERNVALYKDDENFVHYLVELAIYLMECEYDWSQSAEMPEGLRLRHADENTVPVIPVNPNSVPGPVSSPHPAPSPNPYGSQQNVSPQTPPPGDEPAMEMPAEPIKQLTNIFNTSPILRGRKSCPFCGCAVGDALICPSCRNLTR